MLYDILKFKQGEISGELIVKSYFNFYSGKAGLKMYRQFLL